MAMPVSITDSRPADLAVDNAMDGLNMQQRYLVLLGRSLLAGCVGVFEADELFSAERIQGQHPDPYPAVCENYKAARCGTIRTGSVK